MVKENNFPKLKEEKPPILEAHVKNEINISEKRYKKIGEIFAMIIQEIADLSVPEKTIAEWGGLIIFYTYY